MTPLYSDSGDNSINGRSGENKKSGEAKDVRPDIRPKKRAAFCGMFTALAVIMGYVESFIVIPGLLPGMKLGLANCAVILVLLLYGFPYAALVSLLRILIINSLFGNLTWALFSFAGAALSLLVMGLLKKSNAFSVVGISVAGGVAHNFGQTLTAMAIFENAGMIYYFPLLIVFGFGAGLFVGLASGLVYKRVLPYMKRRLRQEQLSE